jgi:drug/metabolite transporter (DMT)-like permease
VALVATSAAAFGTLALLGRYAYAAGMDAVTILFLRFTLAALLMAGLLWLRREPWPRGGVLLRLVGMGAIGYVGQSLAYLNALHFASAGLVALLLYLYPAFVAALSVLVLRERLPRPKLLALGLALAGTALTVGPAGGQALGILLAISAAAIYSVYILVGTQVMRQVSAVQSSAVIFAAAGAALGVMLLFSPPRLPQSGQGWAIIAAIVLVATVLPVVAFLAGLERIGPTNAALISTLEPVVTIFLATALLHERLAPLTLLGGALVLVAVALLTRGELSATTTPAPAAAPPDASA